MRAAQDILLVQNILTKKTPTACWIHFPLTCMSTSTSSVQASSGMPSELKARYRILLNKINSFALIV